MKLQFTALLLACATSHTINAQSVFQVFSENMGNTSVGSSTVSARTFTGFENYGKNDIVYSAPTGSTTTIRDNANSSSTSDYVIASGGNHAYMNVNSGTYLTISGINVSGASNMKLFFGMSKTSTTDDGTALEIAITVDGNSVSTHPTLATGAGTTKWYYIESSVNIPTGAAMTLSFVNNSSQASYRIDDILVTSATPMPVAFRTVKALRMNNNVLISWSTLQENNNDHFEVQASTDGKVFKTIKTVQSKNGNSDIMQEYQVALSVSDISGALVFSISFMVIGFGLRRKLGFALSFVSIIIFIIQLFACNKSKEIILNDANTEIFVRVKQVDMDGAFKYSNIVEVVNE